MAVQRLAATEQQLWGEGKTLLSDSPGEGIRNLTERRPPSATDLELEALRLTLAGLEQKLRHLALETRLSSGSINAVHAPEGLQLLRSVVRRDAALLKDLERVELVRMWDAVKAPIQRHGGAAEGSAGSHASQVLSADQPPVMLIYGPYDELEPGNYLVTWRLRFKVPPSEEDCCFLDACHEAVTFSGRNPGGAEAPPGEWAELSVPLANPVRRAYAFRFWPHGRAVELDRICAFRLHGGTAPPADGSNQCSVMGAVHRAGPVRIPAGSSVSLALEEAGGAKNFGDMARSRIRRTTDGRHEVITVDSRQAGPLPAMRQGDIVEKSWRYRKSEMKNTGLRPVDLADEFCSERCQPLPVSAVPPWDGA